MTTSQLPPEWQIKVTKIAEDFYTNDKDLTVEQRQKLYSCFRKQTFAFPVITLPVLFGAIKVPRRFFTGQKLRVAQIASGLGGVLIGTRLSQIVGFQWNLNSLPADSNEHKCYSILGQAPPQIGLRYYGNTVKHPELKMKDPKETDWNTSPAFPLNLIFSQAPPQHRQPQHLYQRPDREAEKWRQGYEQNAKDSRNVIDKRAEFESSQLPDSGLSTGYTVDTQPGTQQTSSWDEVRKRSQTPQSSPYQTPSTPSIPSYSSESNFSAEQRKFDQLIEKERQMSDGHHDDFANDEKKW